MARALARAGGANAVVTLSAQAPATDPAIGDGGAVALNGAAPTAVSALPAPLRAAAALLRVGDVGTFHLPDGSAVPFAVPPPAKI